MDRKTYDSTNQSAFVNSFFSSSLNQDSMNVYNGSNGSRRIPSALMPSASIRDQEAEKPYKLWSEASGESYELTKSVQALLRGPPDNPESVGFRNPSDSVSNILDEVKVFDINQYEWEHLASSPNSEILTMQILNYLESNYKIQNNNQQSTSFPNGEDLLNAGVNTMDEDFKDQFLQQLCGRNASRHWLVDSPDGGAKRFPIPRPQSEEAKATSVCDDTEREMIQMLLNYNEAHDTQWIQPDKTAENSQHYRNKRYPQNGPNPFALEHALRQEVKNQFFTSDQLTGLSNRVSSNQGRSVLQSDKFTDRRSAHGPFNYPTVIKNKICHGKPPPLNMNMRQCNNDLSQMGRNMYPCMQKENISTETSVRCSSMIEQMKKEERRQPPRFSQPSHLLRSNSMRSENTQHYVSHNAYDPKFKPPNSSYNHRSNGPDQIQAMFPNGMTANNCVVEASGEIQAADHAINRQTFAAQLPVYLDNCGLQCRYLAAERQKAEAVLNNTFEKPFRWETSGSFPLEAQKDLDVCQVVAAQNREQATVSSLLDKMKNLHTHPFKNNIYATLNRHQTTVCIAQARMNAAVVNKRQVTYHTDDKVNMLLLLSIKDLIGTTRKLRTSIWCALQLTLPEPIAPWSHSDLSKEAPTETASDEGYSLSI